MTLEPKTQVFFKKVAQSEKTLPNAVFLRSVRNLNGNPVVEIEYQKHKWLVKESEIMPALIALQARAKELYELFEAKRSTLTNPDKKSLAKALGISEGTLRKRMKFIQNFLQK